MSALTETLFVTRFPAWHGMGRVVREAPTSKDAIVAAGLNWEVESRKMYLANGIEIPDAYANVRTTDSTVLGIVGNRYTIVQNTEAFSFTDNLIGEGCVYETAGSLRNGKQIWLLARLPESVQIAGDAVMPYLCFTNTHDGSGAVKVFMTPVRIVCQNTLNQALSTAKRTWSARHTGSIENKLREATETLQLANNYMVELKKTSETLALQKIDEDKLLKMIADLVPIEDGMSDRTKTSLKDMRNDIWFRYTFAPDLKDTETTLYRFVNAVADTTTHKEPNRLTKNWRENQFASIVAGSSMLDQAYKMALAMAA